MSVAPSFRRYSASSAVHDSLSQQDATSLEQPGLQSWTCSSSDRGPCAVVSDGASDCTRDTQQQCSPRYRGHCLAAPPDALPCISGVLSIGSADHRHWRTSAGHLPTWGVRSKSSDRLALQTPFGADVEVSYWFSWELTWFNKQIPGDGSHVSREPSGNRVGYERRKPTAVRGCEP